MKQIIYVDILFIVNLYVNFILLLITAKFLHKNVNKFRLALASVLGAFYSFVVFLNMPSFLLLILQLAMVSAITLIFIKITSLFDFIKSMLCFYLVNIIFAGGMYALWTWIQPSNMIVKNSIVYFNISPLLLIVTTLIIYAFLAIINRITQGRNMQNKYSFVEFDLFDNHITLSGYYDSGNVLHDVFTNIPVVICKYDSIKSKLPPQLVDLLDDYFKTGCFNNIKNNDYIAKIRLIPCETINLSNLIPTIKPNNFTVIIDEKKHLIEKVLIGITNQHITNENYDMLLNADITDNILISR